MENIKNANTIRLFHAHIYYGKDTLEEARSFRLLAGKTFGIEVGHLHEGPIGPHIAWSCQLTIPKDRFGEIVPWLALNRGNLDFFIHPDTGQDFLDHTRHVMWLGKSYPLRLDFFDQSLRRG